MSEVTGSSIKSFWDKKEGKYGKAFLITATAALAGAGIFVFGFLGLTVVPIINDIMNNVIHMMIAGATIAVPVILCMNKDFRRFVSGIFKDSMRKLARVRKPIDRMNDYIDYLKGCLERQTAGIQALQGVIETNENLVQTVNNEIQESISLASTAERKKDFVTLSFQKEKIGRKTASNKKIQRQIDLAKPLLERVKQIKIMTTNTVGDTKDKILTMKREDQSTRALAEAMGGAMGTIEDNDEKAAFEDAMEQLAEQNGERVGRVKVWMEESETYLNTESLRSALFEEEGARRLEEYLKKPLLDFENGNSLSMDGKGGVQVESTSQPSQAFQAMSDTGSDYLASILKKKQAKS